MSISTSCTLFARGAAIEALHREWTQGGENKQLTVIDAGVDGGVL